MFIFNVQASPYANLGLAFVKVIDMTAGGPDDSIFGYGTSSGDGRVDVPFSGVSYFLWVIFIVIMTVLFINFLVSIGHAKVDPYVHNDVCCNVAMSLCILYR